MASLNSASRHLNFVDYRPQNCLRTQPAKMLRSAAKHAFASFLLKGLYISIAPPSLHFWSAYSWSVGSGLG